MKYEDFILEYVADFGVSVEDCLKCSAHLAKTIKPRAITESDKFVYWCEHDAEPVWNDIEDLMGTEEAIKDLVDAFMSRNAVSQ